MFENSAAFGGFAVDDIDVARAFYSDTLGLAVETNEMGILDVTLAGGGHIVVYPQPDYQPAGFTVLNFPVEDVEAAVDELNARGVVDEDLRRRVRRGRERDHAGLRARHRVVPRPRRQRDVGDRSDLSPAELRDRAARRVARADQTARSESASGRRTRGAASRC